MNNLTSILIEGNVVREAEIRTTPKGTPVANFQIASNRFYKQETGMEKEVSFFTIEAWSRLAESAGEKVKKGRGIIVVGRLKQERWKDKEGRTQAKVIVVTEHLEFRPES
jgi:single-strand DNA-binding protein